MMYHSLGTLKIVSRRDQFIDLFHKSIYSSLRNTSRHRKSFENIFSMEITKTSQIDSNIRKPLCILAIPKSKINLSLKMKMKPKSFRKQGLTVRLKIPSKASNKTMTFTNKTTNIYRLTREDYEKIVNDSITATYKNASNNIRKKINAAGKQVLRYNKVLKRMETNGEKNCFISLKDHKENFQNNPTVRLINPPKNELGKIRKVILDRINKNIRENLQFNQ